MATIIFYLRDFLWQGPLLLLLIGTGIYLTYSLRFIQFRKLAKSMALVVKPGNDNKDSIGDISSFQSLMTALAGAIGTGNITGIATAITTGGFGALLWMWIVAFLVMPIAYSETYLGVKYRRLNKNKQVIGGPMTTLRYCLGAHKLSIIFAILGATAAFGIGGLVQSNSVVSAIQTLYPIDNNLLGIILATLTALVVIGGVSTIGSLAGILVPVMALTYVSLGLYIIVLNADKLLPALELIFTSAFNSKAVLGGSLGAGVLVALQQGAAFGIFANEAGLGSLSIAGASAKTANPHNQGLLAIAGVFISTMLVCTITGLVLAVTQVVGTVDGSGELITGSPLALLAFASISARFEILVVVGLTLFAFTTTLAWAYYGEKCIEFLYGVKVIFFYRCLYILSVLFGAILSLELVWALSHLANGLMALPNLYAVIRARNQITNP